MLLAGKPIKTKNNSKTLPINPSNNRNQFASETQLIDSPINQKNQRRPSGCYFPSERKSGCYVTPYLFSCRQIHLLNLSRHRASGKSAWLTARSKANVAEAKIPDPGTCRFQDAAPYSPNLLWPPQKAKRSTCYEKRGFVLPDSEGNQSTQHP